MAVSAGIHPVHNDEALWIQQFVMHIICRGGDLLESWVTETTAAVFSRCSWDTVHVSLVSKFSEHLFFTEEPHQPNKTNARIHPNYKQTVSSILSLEFPQETGDVGYQNIFNGILGDQLKSFKDQIFDKLV